MIGKLRNVALELLLAGVLISPFAGEHRDYTSSEAIPTQYLISKETVSNFYSSSSKNKISPKTRTNGSEYTANLKNTANSKNSANSRSSERENKIPRKLRPVLHFVGGGSISYVTAFGLEKIAPNKLGLAARCAAGVCMGTLANLVKEIHDYNLGYEISKGDVGLGSLGAISGAAVYLLQEKLQGQKEEKRKEVYFQANGVRIVHRF